jgi:hypothetical protein
MSEIDWDAPAKLLQRDDTGSEMFYEFREVSAGSLADLVADVAAQGAHGRARMVIDAGAFGTFGVDQILGLAGREDFPGNAGGA